MSRTHPALVWFRRDLRLADNPAWATATRRGDEVAAVFVVDPVPWGRAGDARRAELVGHLSELHRELTEAGGGLHVLHGDPTSAVPELARRLAAGSVHVNSDVSAYATRRDRAVRANLGGIEFCSHWGNFVHPPASITARTTGEVHKVFTPFHRAWKARPLDPWPRARHVGLVTPSEEPRWPAVGHTPAGRSGTQAATRLLADWIGRVDDYQARHDDLADPDGTSQLSRHLRFGTVAARHVVEVVGDSSGGRAAFVRQLAWRDWYGHLFAADPDLARRSMTPPRDAIRWRDDPEGFEAWTAGRTGYPVVDAGMRELARTGWMHNRARMITASFLIKDLLIDWRVGEAHFRRELLDYDLSQNAGNWQWVAGTGPDAAPYFRVLNPVTQSRRFDPTGAYIRRWVPELADLPDEAIHAPWESAPLDLALSGVVLGEDYPAPIVDHRAARERALRAYAATAGGG